MAWSLSDPQADGCHRRLEAQEVFEKFARDEACQIVRATASGDGHGWTYLVWVTEQRGTTLKLPEVAWAPEVVRSIAMAVGAQVVSVDETLDLREINNRYPGTFPWAAAHPNQTAAIVVAVMVLGAIAGVF